MFKLQQEDEPVQRTQMQGVLWGQQICTKFVPSKVRRQGRYKELKIAPVYPQPQFVEYVTLEQEKIEKLLGGMHLSSEDGEEW